MHFLDGVPRKALACKVFHGLVQQRISLLTVQRGGVYMSVCQNVLFQAWSWMVWGVLSLCKDLVNVFVGYRFTLERLTILVPSSTNSQANCNIMLY